MHLVIYNILVTNDINNKVFDYIYPWFETLAYISWKIIASYRHTLNSTPGLYLFSIDMIFKFTSIIYFLVIITIHKFQIDIYNARKNSKRDRHDYAVGNISYVDNTSIY